MNKVIGRPARIAAAACAVAGLVAISGCNDEGVSIGTPPVHVPGTPWTAKADLGAGAKWGQDGLPKKITVGVTGTLERP
jgi:hypothetical protein